MNSINEIFGIYFYRKQFNNLVQKLRDKGCLNEENLEKVIKYRKRSIIFYRVCLYSLVFPALFFLGYLFYLFLTNFDGLIRQGVANICIQVFGAAFIVCLYIWGKIECVQKEWRYVYLATLGKRNTGRVLSFVGVGGGGFFGDIEKLCVYDFYDENGHSYIVKSR